MAHTLRTAVDTDRGSLDHAWRDYVDREHGGQLPGPFPRNLKVYLRTPDAAGGGPFNSNPVVPRRSARNEVIVIND